MHPIFTKRTWFAAYLALLAFLALMLAGLLRMPGTLSWRDALLIALPLCLFYDFVCLTPWYMCRQLPLRSSNWLKLASNRRGAAVLAAAIWVELARLMAYLLGVTKELRPEIPHLLAVALLLYSLS